MTKKQYDLSGHFVASTITDVDTVADNNFTTTDDYKVYQGISSAIDGSVDGGHTQLDMIGYTVGPGLTLDPQTSSPSSYNEGMLYYLNNGTSSGLYLRTNSEWLIVAGTAFEGAIDHNDIGNIQGGDSTNRWHASLAQYQWLTGFNYHLHTGYSPLSHVHTHASTTSQTANDHHNQSHDNSDHSTNYAEESLYNLTSGFVDSHSTLYNATSGFVDSHSTLYLLVADIDDTPVDAEVSQPISSNWAFDHAASPTDINHITDAQLGTLHATYTNAEAVLAVEAAGIEIDTTKTLSFTDNAAVTIDIIRDEDDMSSDDANALATQQSIKKYVDDNAGGGGVDTSGTPVANDYARFTDADTIEGRSYTEVKQDLSLEDADINTLVDAKVTTHTADDNAHHEVFENLVEDLSPVLAANLDADTHKIVNVVDPTADQDAATKKYVDDATVDSACSVTSNGPQTFTTGVSTIVQYDTEEYDLNSDYNTGTYKFVVPVAGIYYIHAQVILTLSASWGDAEYIELKLFKNNAEVKSKRLFYSDTVTQQAFIEFNCDIQLAASDSLDIRLKQTSGADIAIYTSHHWNFISYRWVKKV